MKTYPKDWLSRRWHSLLGLWLVVYIVEHLLTNSQAALWIGNDGSGFINAVNAIHRLPYLHAIELGLLAAPILYHALYGIKYILTARMNSFQGGENKPRLTRHGRNHAYSWQRIAAWILLIGIIGHVVQMRFMAYPANVVVGGTEREYVVRVSFDRGLYTLAPRLGATLYDQSRIDSMKSEYESLLKGEGAAPANGETYNPRLQKLLVERQDVRLLGEWVEALESKPLKQGQILVATDQFGVASLFTVRDTFKDPWMMILYTLFVLAAVYHGFRGLWSFMIVWGVSLTARSQALMSRVAVSLMVVIGFLGMAAIWLTYWVNLRS